MCMRVYETCLRQLEEVVNPNFCILGARHSWLTTVPILAIGFDIQTQFPP
jgi:hypothetical protein